MATINTPFAAGTISAISGNTITVTGATVASSWVGRAIVLNRNVANSTRSGQWREISAVNVGANTLTIEYTWRVASVLGTGSLTSAFVESVNTSNGQLTITGHDFLDGDYVAIFSTGTLPSGASSTEVYFCDVIDANTIRLCTNTALTTAVSLTTTGSGEIYILRDPDLEAVPQVGDAFHISTDWDDVDNGTTIVKVDNLLYRRAGTITVSGDVTLYAKGLTIDLGAVTRPTFSLAQNSGLIFGAYSSARQASQGCVIRLSAPSSTPTELWGTNSTPGGDVLYHGCQIIVAAPANDYFQRLNRGSNAIARLIDCNISRNFGGRYQGTRSVIRNTVFSDSNAITSAFSTATPFGSLNAPKVVNSSQALYWHWQLSGSGDIRGLFARNLSNRLINMSMTSGGSSLQRLRIINPDYDFSGPTFLQVENANTTANQKFVEYGFEISIKALLAGSLNGGGRVAIYNLLGSEVLNQVSATGRYSTTFLILRRFQIPTTGSNPQNIAFSAGTLLSPYTARFRQYGFEFLTQTFEASAPLSFDWFKVADAEITEASKATVDAYTGFAFNAGTSTLTISADRTNAQIYDRTRAYLVDNMQVPRFGSFNKANNQLLIDWNVNLSTPLSAGGTVVIPGSRTVTLSSTGTYARRFDIQSAATVVVSPGTTNLTSWTFASGATINVSSGSATVTVSSTSGITAGTNVTLVQPSITIELTGLVAGSEVRVLQAGTTTEIAGIESSSTSFSFTAPSAGTLIDIRILKSDYVFLSILDYTVGSTSASIPVSQELDTNYTTSVPTLVWNSSGGTDLGSTSDVYVDVTNKKVSIATGFNVNSVSGVDFQGLYSYLKQQWISVSGLSLQPFPIRAISAAAGIFELRNGWNWANTTTRNLLRNGGYTLYSSNNSTVLERWMNVKTLGSFNNPSSDTAYYAYQDHLISDIGTISRPGPVNEPVQIFGGPSNGNFDRRDVFKIFLRVAGKTYDEYDLVREQSITQLEPRTYLLPLSNELDPNITIADSVIDTNGDGNKDAAPYTGMSVTWYDGVQFIDWVDGGFYNTNYVAKYLGRWYRSTTPHTASASNHPLTSSPPWVPFEGERQIGSLYYPFSVIFEGNFGTKAQVYSFAQWLRRRTYYINETPGDRVGDLVPPFFEFRGTDLVSEKGVFLSNYNVVDTESIVFTDSTGLEITPPPPPKTLTAPSIKDPNYAIRVCLLRQEFFSISAATAINTTTNQINIGTNRLRDSSPISLVSFVSSGGSLTPPTFTGGESLVIGGLYYVKEVSATSITISKTSGGAALDFATAGTGNITVVGFTKLDNSVVPAGSTTGYSVSLTEPSGTTLFLKARGFQNTTLPATATKYFTRTLSWTNTSQTIPDAINFSSFPDEVFNSITAATEYVGDPATISGISFDLNGTIQFDFVGNSTKYVADFYSWYVWQTSTEAGIERIGDLFTAVDSANFRLSPPVQLQNVNSGTVVRLLGFIRRTDNQPLTYLDVSSGVIEYDFDQLVQPFTISSGGGSGLTSTQATQLAELYATLQSSGVFSASSLVNAPTAGLTTGQATQLSNLANTLASPGVFSSSSLANTPQPTVWTEEERKQIRHRLGVDGATSTPSTNSPALGTVAANIISISGDSTAADNLESFFDGTGYNATASTITTPISLNSQYLGYIWIDTNSGVVGTVSGVNGTAANPSSNLADAVTLSTNLGIKKFLIANGSVITTTGVNLTNYELTGKNWILNVNSRFDSCFVSGAQIVGNFQANSTPGSRSLSNILEDCWFPLSLPTVNVAQTIFRRCHFTGISISLLDTTAQFFNCYFENSGVRANNNTSAKTLEVIDCSGRLTLGVFGLSFIYISGGAGQLATLGTFLSSNTLEYTFDWELVTSTTAVVNPVADSLSTSAVSQISGVLSSYDPPTRAEATADKAEILNSLSSGVLLKQAAIDTIEEIVDQNNTNLLTVLNTGLSLDLSSVWSTLVGDITVPNSIGELIKGLDTDTNLLLARLTSARAEYLDKLNISGTLSSFDPSTTTVTVGVNQDKLGYGLSTSERNTLVTAIEAALINDGDGQALINAILQVINSNLDLPSLELQAIAESVWNYLSMGDKLTNIPTTVNTALVTYGTAKTTDLTPLSNAIANIPTNPLLAGSYVAPNNAGIADLLTRLSVSRSSYLDKLNVTGTLANTSNADLFKADVSGILNIPGYFADLQNHIDDSLTNLPTIESNIGLLLSKNMLTLNKPVVHSPGSIVIGNNEVVISLVSNETTDTVTGTRTT